MYYELQLFDKIIHGNLSPFAESTPGKYLLELQKKHETCFNLIEAAFKKHSSDFVLKEKKITNSLHPLAKEITNSQLDIFDEIPSDNLPIDIYSSLNLKKADVLSVVYCKKANNYIFYIKERTDWNLMQSNEAKYYYYNDLLKEELFRLKECIRQAIFNFKASEETEYYIHKLQQALINLSFQLIKRLNCKEQNVYQPCIRFTNTDILNLTFIYLEKLLRFFEINYFNYINQGIQIPYKSTLLKAYNVREKLDLVKSTLLNSNINPTLLQIISIPLIKLSAIKLEERLTYKDLIYCNTYLQTFYDEIKESRDVITCNQINELLYRVNYNSFEMQFYETTIVNSEMEKIDGIQEKIEYLYLRLKTVSQRRCKVNIAFDSGLASLKDQLTEWLEEEIKFLNKKLQLTSKPQDPNLFSETDNVKIEFGLTVAQLSFFYRLQSDVGIITHKIPNEIFTHIGEHCKTINTSSISPSSIKNKYYNIDNSTVEVLKQKTIEMLNQLKNI